MSAAQMRQKTKTVYCETPLSTAGKTVFREYMLLNVFSRDIADAHVSGAIHVNNLSAWILKPNEVMHDLRFFLQNGLKFDNINVFKHSEKPADTFEAALSVALNVFCSAVRVQPTQP